LRGYATLWAMLSPWNHGDEPIHTHSPELGGKEIRERGLNLPHPIEGELSFFQSYAVLSL